MKSFSEQEDNYRLAIHELGHFFAAIHFGIPAAPRVLKPEDRYRQGEQIIGAECSFAHQGTPFQRSVIGFAGIVAELIVGVSGFDVCFPLEKATTKALFYLTMSNFMSLTESDRCAILENKNRWLTFKAAYRILSRQKRKLLALARSARPKPVAVLPPVPQEPLQPVPLPDTFPATKQDFLRLIIEPGGKPGEEAFSRFIKACWPGLHDLRVETQQFNETVKTQHGWERLVRDFVKWSASC